MTAPAPRPAAADTRTPEEIRALMEQPGPGEPMTITEAIRQCEEWRGKTAAWQEVCDKLNARIAIMEADLARTRAERDAALAALPDPMELEGIAGLRAGTSKMLVKMDQDALFAMAARIRALDAATVPAADVPPFLAHRVNGAVA